MSESTAIDWFDAQENRRKRVEEVPAEKKPPMALYAGPAHMTQANRSPPCYGSSRIGHEFRG